MESIEIRILIAGKTDVELLI